MKPTQVILALTAIAYAAPVAEETKTEGLELANDFPLTDLEAYFEHHLNSQESEVNSLQARQFSSSSYNQLTDGTPCRPVTVVYARGTTQAGNVGDPAAVGPILFNNLASRIGLNNLAIQGVTYPANVAGFLAGGDAAGSKTMADLIARVRLQAKRHAKQSRVLIYDSQAASQCPSTKIIISGYSQGAQLVHNAAAMLSASVTNRVTAGPYLDTPKPLALTDSILVQLLPLVTLSGASLLALFPRRVLEFIAEREITSVMVASLSPQRIASTSKMLLLRPNGLRLVSKP